ncbi:MAG: hypothetical protein ACOYIK_06270 [Coriobacteriales bacterium]
MVRQNSMRGGDNAVVIELNDDPTVIGASLAVDVCLVLHCPS